jgi:hypothetical protein
LSEWISDFVLCTACDAAAGGAVISTGSVGFFLFGGGTASSAGLSTLSSSSESLSELLSSEPLLESESLNDLLSESLLYIGLKTSLAILMGARGVHLYLLHEWRHLPPLQGWFLVRSHYRCLWSWHGPPVLIVWQDLRLLHEFAEGVELGRHLLLEAFVSSVDRYLGGGKDGVFMLTSLSDTFDVLRSRNREILDSCVAC